MSKNMTRKAVALGAGLGLVASGFAVLPANAATVMTTAAYHGVSTNLTALAGSAYGMILNTTFSSLPSGHDADDLKYRVKIVTAGFETDEDAAADADASLTDVTFDIRVDSNSDGADLGGGEAVDNGAAATDGNPTGTLVRYGAAITDRDKYVVIPAKAGAEDGADAAGEASAVTPDFEQNNLLRLILDETITANMVVEVTPFVDTIANNAVDGNEPIGETATVTFVPQSKVVPTFGMTTPALGDADIELFASLGDVNMGVFDKLNGSPIFLAGDRKDAQVADAATAGGNIDAVGLSYDPISDRLEGTNALDGAADGGNVAAGTYYANFALDGTNAANFFTSNTAETIVSQVVGDSGLDSDANEGVGKATVSSGANVAQNNGATTAASVDILARADEATTINFSSQLYKTYSTTDPVFAGAGVVVDVTISRATVAKLDADTVITSGGETLDGNDLSITYPVTTDASGKISFSLTTNTAEADDELEIDLAAEGKTATQQTLKWADESYTVYPTVGSSTVKAPIGGSVPVDFVAVDQWNQAPADGSQISLTIASQSGDRDTEAKRSNYSYNVVMTDGKGSVSITDNGSSSDEGTDNLSAQLQVAATAGGGYVNKGSAATFGVNWIDDFASSTLDVDANNDGLKSGATDVQKIAIEDLALVAYDDRFDSATPPAYDFTNGFTAATGTTQENVTVSGSVKTATGSAIANAAVTISGEGMLFATAAGSGRYSPDEITVLTGAAGDYTVYVLGSLGGAQTVTVTSNGNTATETLNFAANTGAADSMSLEVVSSVTDGRTADVKATVLDEFGNPVEGVTVSFKEEGPGYLNTASGTTDGEGEVIVNLITVSGDTGTSTIKATATIDGESTTISETITVGAVAATKKVNAGSFKGYVAVYARGYEGSRLSTKIGKDWIVVEEIVNNQGADLYRLTDFTGAGVDIEVQIWIDRVLIDTIPLTTK